MKILIKITALMLIIGTFGACKNDVKGDKASVSEKGTVAETSGATSYNVNKAASKISWEGSKPTGAHEGIISLSNGTIEMEKGEVVGGSFTIDMNSITCTDLEGDSKAGLEAHLKGMRDEGEEDHFFNVAKYPTAKFDITKVAKLANDENATHLIYGNLTMKDKSNQIGFKAKIDASENKVMVSTPNFKIDRTKWGINYASKSVFDDLKEKFVNDDIGLAISLEASKS